MSIKRNKNFSKIFSRYPFMQGGDFKKSKAGDGVPNGKVSKKCQLFSKKRGMTLIEILVTIIMVAIMVVVILKIVNDLILYKYRAFTAYNVALSNVIVQNSVQKVDIQDFVIGGMTYNNIVGKKDLLYFKNNKFANSPTFFDKAKSLVEHLNIETRLPFFVFLNPEKRIGVFGVEKRDGEDDKYNINLYYLDQNYYSKSAGKDKMQDIFNSSDFDNLVVDFKNQKTVLLKDVTMAVSGSEYYKESDLSQRFMTFKDYEDMSLSLLGGEQIEFHNNYELTSQANVSNYPAIHEAQSLGYYKQYYLMGHFKYFYVGKDYTISFNKIFKGDVL